MKDENTLHIFFAHLLLTCAPRAAGLVASHSDGKEYKRELRPLNITTTTSLANRTEVIIADVRIHLQTPE